MNRYLTFLSLFVVISFSSDIYDIKVFGHRGGIRKLVPPSSLLSFSVGAQMGVDYLECDIVSTMDGELLVMHDFVLDKMTDIAEHDEFSDRKEWFNYTYRATNQISNIWYDERTSHGFHTWDFTLDEIKTLRLRAKDPYFDNSPLNDQFEILTFSEFLDLVHNLTEALGRPIGITPELKAPWVFRELGLEMEETYMQLLYEAGFVDLTDDGYYSANYFVKESANLSIPMVIVQSADMTALRIIGNLSNNDYSDNPITENVPLQFGASTKDKIDYKMLNWISTFAGGINIPWVSFEMYSKAINNQNVTFDRVHFRMEDFVPGENTHVTLDKDDAKYTRQFVRNEYFKALNYNLTDAVFTDNGENIMTIIDMIYEVNNATSVLFEDDYDLVDKELFTSDGDGDDEEATEKDKDGNGWMAVAIVFIILFVVAVIIIIYLVMANKKNQVADNTHKHQAIDKSEQTELASK